ncbi:MAG: polysulfide reductase NrfD [Chloroflexi bacterium]|nr:polysulfide reductase NrfD [Chloroflexota bacterium]
MAWGYQIAIYLFLAGTGAGAFLTARVTEMYGRDNFRPLVRAGAVLSGPVVALGIPFLILDLGIGRWQPWRLAYLYTNLSSPMTWGIYILTAFVPIAFLYGLLEIEEIKGPWLKLRKYRGWLLHIGSLLAVATAIYTGLLIGIVKGVPLWNTTILPVLFVTSAISCGLAAAVVLAIAWPVGDRRLVSQHFFYLNQVHAAMILAELILIFSWLFISAHGSTASQESVRILISGPLSVYFWIGIVVFGIVDPLIIFVYEVVQGRPLVGPAMFVSDGSVLVGGLVLRYLVITAAVPIAIS